MPNRLNLGNRICAPSDQALVLSACIALQMTREARVGSQRWLNRDDDIAGEVGNPCGYQKMLVNPTPHKSKFKFCRCPSSLPLQVPRKPGRPLIGAPMPMPTDGGAAAETGTRPRQRMRMRLTGLLGRAHPDGRCLCHICRIGWSEEERHDPRRRCENRRRICNALSLLSPPRKSPTSAPQQRGQLIFLPRSVG